MNVSQPQVSRMRDVSSPRPSRARCRRNSSRARACVCSSFGCAEPVPMSLSICPNICFGLVPGAWRHAATDRRCAGKTQRCQPNHRQRAHRECGWGSCRMITSQAAVARSTRLPKSVTTVCSARMWLSGHTALSATVRGLPDKHLTSLHITGGCFPRAGVRIANTTLLSEVGSCRFASRCSRHACAPACSWSGARARSCVHLQRYHRLAEHRWQMGPSELVSIVWQRFPKR